MLLIPCCCVLFLIVNVYSQTTESAAAGSRLDPVTLTRDGLIRGRRARTVGRQVPYYAFQGIPYAEPPTGNRRFRPPVKKSNWIGVLDARQDKSQCLQFSNPPQGSEDCLYINVYTTKLVGKKLPVMAWIHGGGFSLGNSSYISYGPDYLLEEDVVFVSFNYRLGIFGFGSTNDSASPGNYGLKDQILALKWIKDNIGFFGGDANKVTIFGQSAGSASVSYLLQTNLTKDLYRAAIMQSGTSLCLWALDRKSKEAMFTIGQLLGVDTSSSTSLINGLRQIDSSTLQNVAFPVAVNVTLTNLFGGLVFGPVPEEGVVERYSDEALSHGRFNKVPIIIGFTSQEAAGVGGVPEILWQYFQRYENNATGLTPIDLTRNETKRALAGEEIRSFYFGSEIGNQTEAIVQFISDDYLNRPIRRTVLDQSKYVPTFFYKFSYVGPLGTTNRSVEGVGHAEDNNYLFRSYPTFTVPSNDSLTRSRMVRMWTNFAKYLDPTPTRDPLLEVLWLQAKSKPNSLDYLNINTNLKMKRNPFDRYMKFWDNIYSKYGEPPYDTY